MGAAKLFCSMFVRKNRNRSGATSIQVVSKNRGTYKVIKSFGSSNDPGVIEELATQAKHYIHFPDNQPALFSDLTDNDQITKRVLDSLFNSQIRTIGPELIFGTLFDRIGFDVVPDQLFRDIVIARLAYPTSKLKTVDYLYRYRGIQTNPDTIYRFLDKFHGSHKDQVERVVYEHTKALLGGTITVVFYDMTTLYFEAEDEDDLRKIGFSKDGKFQKPQIMLGLLVGPGGYPIGYDIFEGNTFEGKTLLPVLNTVQKRYQISKPVVVADAALLSTKNLSLLDSQGYGFIIGARIKNESDEIKSKILKQTKQFEDGQAVVIDKSDGYHLIVTYSQKRAAKDQANRNKGIRRLRIRISSGRLTKKHINNRGYNKFLVLDGPIKVSLDQNKIKQDTLWDGLKGYVTNTQLPPKDIVEHYKQLWQIEKAFRISKTDLRIRPIYHYRKKRIETHILIAFVAYSIYKELERQLDKNKSGITPKRAVELANNMYRIEYQFPDSKRHYQKNLNMDSEQQNLVKIIQ